MRRGILARLVGALLMAERRPEWSWASFLSLPLVVAIVVAIPHCSMQRASIAREYVSLAVQVLSAPRKVEEKDRVGDELLRKWALDILRKYTPVRLDEALARKLETGEVTLPAVAEFDAAEFDRSEFGTGARARGRAAPQIEAPADR